MTGDKRDNKEIASWDYVQRVQNEADLEEAVTRFKMQIQQPEQNVNKPFQIEAKIVIKEIEDES